MLGLFSHGGSTAAPIAALRRSWGCWGGLWGAIAALPYLRPGRLVVQHLVNHSRPARRLLTQV